MSSCRNVLSLVSEPGALGSVMLDDGVGVVGVVVGFAAMAGVFNTCISSYLLVRRGRRTFLAQAGRASVLNWRGGRVAAGGRRAWIGAVVAGRKHPGRSDANRVDCPRWLPVPLALPFLSCSPAR